jgi:hypothetical protein
VKRSKKLELEITLMKPFTIAVIGALVVAVAVFGYLYYQRTRNDITIQMPKVELKRIVLCDKNRPAAALQ